MLGKGFFGPGVRGRGWWEIYPLLLSWHREDRSEIYTVVGSFRLVAAFVGPALSVGICQQDFSLLFCKQNLSLLTVYISRIYPCCCLSAEFSRNFSDSPGAWPITMTKRPERETPPDQWRWQMRSVLTNSIGGRDPLRPMAMADGFHSDQ